MATCVTCIIPPPSSWSRTVARIFKPGINYMHAHMMSSICECGCGNPVGPYHPLTVSWRDSKGQATLCVQSAQYRTRSSEIAFLRTVQVWLGTCNSYQLNIVSDYAITQYGTNASDIAHLVRIVCSGLNNAQWGNIVNVNTPFCTPNRHFFILISAYNN